MTNNTDQTFVCPRCGAVKLKSWQQLTFDEKLMVERLPCTAGDYSLDKRKQHRFCVRCWFEDADRRIETA